MEMAQTPTLHFYQSTLGKKATMAVFLSGRHAYGTVRADHRDDEL